MTVSKIRFSVFLKSIYLQLICCYSPSTLINLLISRMSGLHKTKNSEKRGKKTSFFRICTSVSLHPPLYNFQIPHPCLAAHHSKYIYNTTSAVPSISAMPRKNFGIYPSCAVTDAAVLLPGLNFNLHNKAY